MLTVVTKMTNIPLPDNLGQKEKKCCFHIILLTQLRITPAAIGNQTDVITVHPRIPSCVCCSFAYELIPYFAVLIRCLFSDFFQVCHPLVQQGREQHGQGLRHQPQRDDELQDPVPSASLRPQAHLLQKGKLLLEKIRYPLIWFFVFIAKKNIPALNPDLH